MEKIKKFLYRKDFEKYLKVAEKNGPETNNKNEC
jgi:hypothetical protein